MEFEQCAKNIAYILEHLPGLIEAPEPSTASKKQLERQDVENTIKECVDSKFIFILIKQNVTNSLLSFWMA